MKLNIPRVVKNWKYADKIVISNNDFELNGAGFGRRFAIQDDTLYWKEAFNEFGLVPNYIEPMYKNMVGNHFLDGAFVQEHTDQAPEGYVHTRCNLMIKKPNKGGNPILDGEEIDVEVNDLWLCLASLEKHASTPILGGERLIYSFGALVDIDQIRKII
jgi:hypothetical protein